MQSLFEIRNICLGAHSYFCFGNIYQKLNQGQFVLFCKLLLYWRHVDEEPSLQPDGSTNPRPCTSLPALICAVTCRLSPWPRVIVGASLVVANSRLYLAFAHVVLCLQCISVSNSLPHCPYQYHRRGYRSLTLGRGYARR